MKIGEKRNRSTDGFLQGTNNPKQWRIRTRKRVSQKDSNDLNWMTGGERKTFIYRKELTRKDSMGEKTRQRKGAHRSPCAETNQPLSDSGSLSTRATGCIRRTKKDLRWPKALLVWTCSERAPHSLERGARRQTLMKKY